MGWSSKGRKHDQPPSPKPTPSDGWNPGSSICLHSKNETKRKLVEQKGGSNKMLEMFMRRIHLKAMIESLKQYQTTTKVWERCSLFYSMFFLLLWRSPLVFLWINPILDCISEFDSNTGKKSCTSSCTPKTVRNEMHSLHQVVCNLFLFRGIYSSSAL